MPSNEKNTEEAIIEAAREIFLKKGFAGARMQEIADQAGINKAMLHYYFRSKEKLFEAIFVAAVREMMSKMSATLNSDMPLFEKIGAFVERYLEFGIRNPFVISFILHELNQNPDKIISEIFSIGGEHRPNPNVFFKQVEQAVQNGEIRPVQPVHLLINILSMTIFPFIARPMIQAMLRVDEKEFPQLIRSRAKEIVSFVEHSLRV